MTSQRSSGPCAAVTRAALLIATFAALAGCTSMLTPLGAEYYDCNRKENPTSPYCHSFRSVANGTNSTIPDSRYDADVRISDVDRLAGIAPDGVASAPIEHIAPLSPAAIQASRQPRQAGAGIASSMPERTPVRVAPLVQRTWVKRHVEQGDRLVGSTYVYREVTHSHWQGYADASADTDSRTVTKPHLADDDTSALRSATSNVNKAATGLLSRVKSSLSQPGVAAPGGDVVAPPIDGASMPQ